MHQKNVDYKILSFPIHGDETGKLVALEKGNDIPFEIKRVYYIWDTYKEIVGKYDMRGENVFSEIERFKFYEEAKSAYAIVATGETAIYANIMLQKGVVIN